MCFKEECYIFLKDCIWELVQYRPVLATLLQERCLLGELFKVKGTRSIVLVQGKQWKHYTANPFWFRTSECRSKFSFCGYHANNLADWSSFIKDKTHLFYVWMILFKINKIWDILVLYGKHFLFNDLEMKSSGDIFMFKRNRKIIKIKQKLFCTVEYVWLACIWINIRT